MHLFDDDFGEYLAKLRTGQLVGLKCPDCAHVVYGKGLGAARILLAIHQEGTCQGGGEQ